MKNLVALVAMCFALGACGAKTAEAVPPSSANDAKQGSGHCACEKDSCPMQVSGVTMAYEDASDGATIVFSVEGTDAIDLQQRVAKMAEKHNRPQGEHGPDHVVHSARVDNTEKGARLVLTPSNPSDLEALRTQVRGHVEMMQKGECPMTEHGHDGHHGDGHGPGPGH